MENIQQNYCPFAETPSKDTRHINDTCTHGVTSFVHIRGIFTKIPVAIFCVNKPLAGCTFLIDCRDRVRMCEYSRYPKN